MSAQLTDMHNFIDSWLTQLDDIHPSAAAICHEYISEMRAAVDGGNMTEFRRLFHLTQDKIKDELEWEAEKRVAKVPNENFGVGRKPGKTKMLIEQTDG